MDLMRLSSLCKSAGETCANRDELVKVVCKKTKYSLLCRGLLAMEMLTQHKSSNVPHSTAQHRTGQRSTAQRSAPALGRSIGEVARVLARGSMLYLKFQMRSQQSKTLQNPGHIAIMQQSQSMSMTFSRDPPSQPCSTGSGQHTRFAQQLH